MSDTSIIPLRVEAMTGFDKEVDPQKRDARGLIYLVSVPIVGIRNGVSRLLQRKSSEGADILPGYTRADLVSRVERSDNPSDILLETIGRSYSGISAANGQIVIPASQLLDIIETGTNHTKFYHVDFESLEEAMAKYAEVREADTFAANAHRGQLYGGDGSKYHEHIRPVSQNTARSVRMLTNLHGTDHRNTVQGALLHDVDEDTVYSIDDISRRFGDDIASMVRGMTKKEKDGADRTAAAYQAAESDPRIALVHGEDRLMNILYISFLAPEKQKAMITETREVHIPLLEMHGLNIPAAKLKFAVALYDAGAQFYGPDRTYMPVKVK